MNVVLSNSLRFFFLLMVQVLLLNQIDFGGASPYLTAYLYLLFILLLPVNVNLPVIMGISLFTGLCVDFFYNTYGMHASATLFAGYIRHYVLKAMAPREGYDIQSSNMYFTMGLQWKLTYFGIVTLAHHLWFFTIEVFRFSGIFDTFFRALTSTIFTLLLMVITVYLFYKPTERR
jgi:rod shape-determining protein MreD